MVLLIADVYECLRMVSLPTEYMFWQFVWGKRAIRLMRNRSRVVERFAFIIGMCESLSDWIYNGYRA